MASFYFPCLGLVPHDGPSSLEASEFTLLTRQWDITTFDFATLAASHRLHFSWHLLDVFMRSVNCEVEARNCADYAAAQGRVRCLQAMLYVEGLSPFIMPIGMTHRMSDYAGINSRDSEWLREKLPFGLQKGFTSKSGKIEGWVHEPTLQCTGIPEKMVVTDRAFKAAARNVPRWLEMEQAHPPLATARRALQTSPMIPDLGSSLLHAWQGIEALFPTISTEVTFRLSLMIAQLCAPARKLAIGLMMRQKKVMPSAHEQRTVISTRLVIRIGSMLGICLLFAWQVAYAVNLCRRRMNSPQKS
jgi:hypothetical protein